MLSTILFTLSALCFVAMCLPSKSASQPAAHLYTYYFGEDEPLPTWQRKAAPTQRKVGSQVRVGAGRG